MARRRGSLSNAAVSGNWKATAIITILMLVFVFFWLPSTTNPFLKIFSSVLKPLGYLLVAVFALETLMRFSKAKSERSGQPKDSLEQAIARWQMPGYAPTGSANFEMKMGVAKPIEWSLRLIQEIEWKKFEELATAYYQEKGIRAVATPLGADGGIDIKLYQDGLGAPTSIVQCKAWGSRLVGVKPIREFLGVMHHEKISKGFYMTSGGYTEEAKEIAKANGITLITGEMLLMMIGRLPDESKARLLALSTEGDYMTPTCATCGVKMVKRSSKRGEFWGCRNYPRCKQMLHVRKS